jgi:hypothetical protein
MPVNDGVIKGTWKLDSQPQIDTDLGEKVSGKAPNHLPRQCVPFGSTLRL